MTSTVVVRGSAGAIFTMDVPAAGHLREMFDEKLASGALVIVDEPTGSPEAPSVSAEPPRRGRPPKVQAPADPAVEAATVDAEE